MSQSNDPQIVTREELYTLVWSEPMLKVATKFSVSSSYMARICTLMNVPRPERGYWAKLAVGKHVLKPGLPEARPDDQVLWNRSGVALPVRRALPRPPPIRPRRKREAVSQQPGTHLLVHGARAHFEAGRTSYDSQYLKPSKRLLVDLVVTKNGLDKALTFASDLFLELEAHDYRVVLAARGGYMHRARVDEHEVAQKRRADDYYGHHRLWSPGRITVVYVGTVAFGLTVIELAEEVEARYVKGEYVRVDSLPPLRHRKYQTDDGWTTKRDFPTGRLCLQAYSPDSRCEWTKQWREKGDRDLKSQIPAIVRELFDAAPVVAGLIEEGERKAELQRQQWEVERKEHERVRAEEDAAKARRDSREELLRIIDAWAEANRIEQFFLDAESTLKGLDDLDERSRVQDRLKHARKLIGSTGAFERFRRWQSPEERQRRSTDGR